MRSLLIRIFASFWSIIVITIIAAAALGYAYAERARATLQNFEVSDAMLEASAALQADGREGLVDWLRSLPGVTSSLIYVLDDRGRDVLNRRLPPPVVVAMRRFGNPEFRRPRPNREPGNLRPARPFTQLIGPDDRVYTFFVLPPQGTVGRWLTQRGVAGVTVLAILALLISAVVSYLLARTISQPIRRFRESAVAIADGNLDTRVTDRVGGRRDEIGLLARDFDRMANELQRAWLAQAELTRNVSHELRSPLARLRVALELARRKAGDLPEFEKIDGETGRLDELIGQILEFSRLDVDSKEARTVIQLDELAQSVVQDVRYEYGLDAGETGIAFESDCRADVDGYPGAVRSGIENVLRNAAQHSRESGAVQVTLRKEGPHAVLEVTDRGGGVSESDIRKIFEPFYRATGGHKQPNSGSGLGLAIAARAIAMNDGTITASNIGDGLRVEIRLPLAD